MGGVAEYRRIISDLINTYAQWKPSLGEVIVEAITDEAADHYELIYSGWRGHDRIHGSVIHIDIRDGKVWVQHDGTEDAIAEKLVEAGIPRDEIVLGFLSPRERELTPFAAMREAA